MHDRACISIRASFFRVPDDIVNTSMIMVGAGTGLAPMIGFLEDRAYAFESEGEEKKTDQRITNCHLFFGCRTHDERIYRQRIEDWEQGDVLNLHLALSRSPDRSKMYVQDMIKEKGDILCGLLLRDDCTYYICGDANMADFVYDALVEALRENANMSQVKATNLSKRMRFENRWQYDLWGISSYMDDDSYSAAKRNAAKRKANRALNWLSSIKKKINQSGDGDDSF